MLQHPLYKRSYPGCPGAIDIKMMQPYYLKHLRDFDIYPPTIEQLDNLIKEKYPDVDLYKISEESLNFDI